MSNLELKSELTHELNKSREKYVASYRRRLRQERFSERRNLNNQPLSYFKDADEWLRKEIEQSLTGPIPDPLPPITTTTISYYRRAGRPRYKPNPFEDPHSTYESLYMLALIEQEKFANYPEVVNAFESQLSIFLGSKYPQIVEMAVLVAGNKCLGSSQNIMKICELNPGNLWVLVNHILEEKMSFTIVLHGFPENNVECFKCIADLLRQPNKCDVVLDELLKNGNENILDCIVRGVLDANREICCANLKILASLFCSSNEENLRKLAQNNEIIVRLYHKLQVEDQEVRRFACWALSNFPAESEERSTRILQYSPLLERMLEMVLRQLPPIQREIMHFFLNIIEKGSSEEVQKFLYNYSFVQSVLATCLEVDQQQVQLVTVKIIVMVLDRESMSWNTKSYFRQRIEPLTRKVKSLSYSIEDNEAIFDRFEWYFKNSS